MGWFLFKSKKVYNEEDLKTFRETFDVFDKNHDNLISIEEMKNVLNAIGEHPSEEELKELMRVVDKNGKGGINFEEFIEILTSAAPKKQKRCFFCSTPSSSIESLRKEDTDEQLDLKKTFEVFDENKDGLISCDEFINIMKKLGMKELTKEEVQSLIASVDTDYDGHLNFEEFQMLMKKC